MESIFQAFGPAGVVIIIFGSVLMFLTNQVGQLRADVRHIAFMNIKRTARLVEHKMLPIESLAEDLNDLEELLNTSQVNVLVSVLKATMS